MKHIAVPCRGAFGDRPYTATGLGDRIHVATIAWSYSQAHGTPVTLHLTEPMMTGGEFGNKPQSWREILSLLPHGQVDICAHQANPRTAEEWFDICGAESYGHGDYLPRKGFDAAAYLKNIPLLTAESQPIDLPERFFTAQWDAGGPSRRVAKRAEGGLIVGGESKDEHLRWSLKHIAYAMSKAYAHAGVDSGFFHLAQLFMPIDRIHVYCGERPGHHVLRARDNGAKINCAPS